MVDLLWQTPDLAKGTISKRNRLSAIVKPLSWAAVIIYRMLDTSGTIVGG